ncbi:hypothetical protein [Streptomyces sp. NPDC049944]|uniref:glycine cleavage system protein H n=1 Tax=Streptomyces sp. NPDC049944 TaxID=3155657 RepID=UPI00343CD9D7
MPASGATGGSGVLCRYLLRGVGEGGGELPQVSVVKTAELAKVVLGDGAAGVAVAEDGGIVHVLVPEVDAQLKEFESYGTVESARGQVIELIIPFGATVVEVNEAVVDEPALMTDPQGEGWLVRVRPTDSNDLGELMDAAQYEKEFDSETA